MGKLIRSLAAFALLLGVAGEQGGLGRALPRARAGAQSGSKYKRTPKRKRKMNKSANAQHTGKLPTGLWGGDHISLQVTADGARLEFDCAHGSIAQAITLDADNAFDVPGSFTPEHGGPVRSDEKPRDQSARYTGRVEGRTMTLTITLADKQDAGTYTLVQGQSPDLFKCK